MPYIEIVTLNKKMIKMYGDKLTPIQKLIGRRSNGLHTEIRFSLDYGGISFSCTLADGVGGCRFKMIGYSHGYRWSTVRIAVSAEQEARLFAKACEMADFQFGIDSPYKNDNLLMKYKDSFDSVGSCYYGPNHVKYDINGARFAFILKWEWWKMHRIKMICNEAVANVMLVVWPDMLVIDDEYHKVKEDIAEIAPQIFIDSYDHKDPAHLAPDQIHYLVEYYFKGNRDSYMGFESLGNPTQKDIDNIIKEVNDEQNSEKKERPSPL